MKQSNLISIAEFAVLCRTTPRTIRFYDKLDLLKPVQIDQFTKYRYYSPFQTRDFFRIRLLQNFDVSLKEISSRQGSDFLDERMEQVKKELDEKKKEYEFLKKIKQYIFDDNLLKHLKTENIGPYTLLGAHFPQGRYDRIDEDSHEVRLFAEKLGLKADKREFTFYLDHDTYKPKDTRLENGVIVAGKISKNLKLPENYFVRTLPKTRALVLNYKGPFEFITLLYERLHELKITEKYKVGLPLDIYIGGPFTTLSPYDYTTKIIFPLIHNS